MRDNKTIQDSIDTIKTIQDTLDENKIIYSNLISKLKELIKSEEDNKN